MSNSSSLTRLSSPGAVALFSGCIIATVLPLIAFLVFVINRSLRVKRLHIISINICLSLIILYTGFLISLLVSDRSRSYEGAATPGCVIGALFVLFGWFCLHFWILANWIYLSFTIEQRVSRHISHFFIKSTIPTYGTALLFFIVIGSMDATQQHKQLVNAKFCWFDLGYEQGVEWVFYLATVLSTFFTIACATFCCVKFTCKRNKNATAGRLKKNKMATIRLTMLTLVVFITSGLQLSWWIHFSRKSSWVEGDTVYIATVNTIDSEYSWLKILHGIFIALEGISAVLYLVLPKDNFHSILSYCTAVIKCQDLSTLQHQNVHSTVRNSSKQGENNNRIDARASMSSEDRPKYEPREEMPQDDVFVPSVNETTPSLSPPAVDKRGSRISATKSEKGSPASPKRPDALGELPQSALQPKKRGIRVSFRKSAKSPITPSSSQTSVDVASSLPKNHFQFNRDSKISMKCEHERKTSF